MDRCQMITGELKSKVDRVWDAFWSGGISNPIEVIEQLTYLLFIRSLDDLNTLAEKKARVTGTDEGILFGPDQQDLRWKNLKDAEPAVMFDVVGQQVFPFLRGLGGDGSTYSEHMKDARFTIPNPALLSRVVDMIDDIPMEDRDTNGDLYEYLLSKIASAGVNGQFRTPRHIIATMVAMMDPQPADEICDPFVMRNFGVSRDSAELSPHSVRFHHCSADRLARASPRPPARRAWRTGLRITCRNVHDHGRSGDLRL